MRGAACRAAARLLRAGHAVFAPVVHGHVLVGHGLPPGWDFWGRFDGVAEAVKFRQERATKQMGTLGSGNHMIEVCLDHSNAVWLMLHSGSRNIGKELAEYHIGVAQGLPHNQGLVDRDLAVFVLSGVSLTSTKLRQCVVGRQIAPQLGR